MVVDFNVFRNFAVLVGKFESDANIAILVYFDCVNKLNQNIPCQFVDIFILQTPLYYLFLYNLEASIKILAKKKVGQITYDKHTYYAPLNF